MSRKPKKYVVVSDTYANIYSDAVIDDLKELYPDYSLEELEELATDLYYDDRRLLMQTFAYTIFPTDVVCIADLGLWNGRCRAHRVYEKPTLDELFYAGHDIEEAEWYVDEYNDLRCDAHHHDGTNHYLYRQIRPELGTTAFENFHNKLLNGTLTRKDLNHYTIALGPIVKTAEQHHYGD